MSVGDAGFGAAFWFAAAMFTKNGPQIVYTKDNTHLLALVGSACVVGGVVFLMKKMTWNTGERAIKGTAMATGTALLLDGVAHSFFHESLYGNIAGVRGAGLIFFGAGAGLVAALLIDKYEKERKSTI